MAQAASCGCARRMAGVVPGVTRSEGGLRRRENRGSSASGAPRRPGAQRNLRVRRHGREVRCRREESTALGRAGPNPHAKGDRPRLRKLQTKRPPTSEAADHPPFSLSLSLSLFSIRSLEHPKRNEKERRGQVGLPPRVQERPVVRRKVSVALRPSSPAGVVRPV